MKQLNLILFTLFFCITVTAQWKTQPTVGISHNLSLYGSYRTDKVSSITNYQYNKSYFQTSVPYQITNINAGVTLVHNNYSLSMRVGYQYFKCQEQLIITPNVKNKHSIKSHFIGLNIVNRFRENKIIRPFLSIELLTEIGSNYKNKYLSTENYDPEIIQAPNYAPFISVNTNFYQSTPFIGNFLVGCDFRIYRGLSANFAWGYGLRVLKAQYGLLYFQHSESSEPITEKKIGNPYTIGLNYLTIELGLNYTFSFKKKPKTTTP